MDLTPQAPAVHFHGDEANLLIANDYKDQQDALDMATAKDYADALNTAYPGHLWAVNVQGEQGIVTIHNLMLSGKYGCWQRAVGAFGSSVLARDFSQIARSWKPPPTISITAPEMH